MRKIVLFIAVAAVAILPFAGCAGDSTPATDTAPADADIDLNIDTSNTTTN